MPVTLTVAISLLSALGGAIIGAIVTDRLAQKRAKERHRRTVAGHLAALKGEMLENVRFAERPILGEAKVKLQTQQWEKSRHFISEQELDPQIAEKIRQAYTEVGRYNEAVDQERAKVRYREGYMNSEIEALARTAKGALEEALQKITQPS